MKRLLANRDLIAGAAFVAVSLVFLQQSLELRMGRAIEMGPGYFPTILSSMLLVLSIVLLGKALVGRRTALGAIDWRSLVTVTASVVLFGALVRAVGLIAATIAVVVVSSLAARDLKWWQILLLTAGLCALVVVVFVQLLKLPFTL